MAKKAMPKNTIILAAVAVLAVVGIGGFFFLNQNKLPGASNINDAAGGVIGDILTSNVSMECNYDDPEQGLVTAYIKGGKVRVNYETPDGMTGSTIMKDDVAYFWNDEGAFMMTLAKEDIDSTLDEVAEEYSQADDIKESIEEYKEYCKNANVSDSNFDLPQGVEFQDFSSMYDGSMMQQIPEYDGGSGDMQIPSEEEIQRMMEQYQGQE